METQRRKNVSEEEDRLSITQRIMRSKKTTENETREENALPVIPIDLTMEIFARLPAKSIARCRCVSKPWAITLRRSDFTELFSTRSSARPQFLFACETGNELVFFSSLQLQNPNENSSPVVVSNHTKIFFDLNSRICRPVNGLVCVTKLRISKQRNEMVPGIYNPCTGQSLVLPKVKTSGMFIDAFTMLGYDPIDKQFKLLSMIWSTYGEIDEFNEYQVLTLGTRRKRSWRKIKSCKPHYSSSKEGICIDAVLYYTASKNRYSSISMAVCFDVRSEKFSFIQFPKTFTPYWHGIPVKYNGRLGFLVSNPYFDRNTESIELCVLKEDGQQWSKHTYVLPILWQDIVGTRHLYIVGMTPTNEIVLATHSQSTMPFYVFYYNIESKTIIRLQIRGMEALENDRVHVFLNYIEDLKLV